jgi:hypothetical protein
MNKVFALIAEKKQDFAQLAFFNFLKDQTLDCKYRLSFAPCFAPFVMGFAELNKYVWREEPTDDPIQAIVNQYTYEDDHHWIWFLEDLQKLELNSYLQFNDFLKFTWSDETQVSRQTIHEIYRYTYQAQPIRKLAVIEAIEAIADIFLSTTTLVTQELNAIEPQEYPYFGSHHIVTEANHTIFSSAMREFITNIKLSEKDIEELCQLVEQTFELFEVLIEALLLYATKHGNKLSQMALTCPNSV